MKETDIGRRHDLFTKRLCDRIDRAHVSSDVMVIRYMGNESPGVIGPLLAILPVTQPVHVELSQDQAIGCGG